MLIIERTLWFLQMAISVTIIAIIVLMIIRAIVDAMDLNPFAWTSRTIRRFTDVFVIPMRAGLRGFGGMNPNFAPLVVILIAILLGYFVLSLVQTIAMTVAGVIQSVQLGAMIAVLGFILYGALSIYLLLIVMRVIFSWGRVSYQNRIMRFLVDVTEPLLGPLRRMLPPVMMFDLSPLVSILIIWLFQAAVAGTLLRGAMFRSF
jgi:YggT family protein